MHVVVAMKHAYLLRSLIIYKLACGAVFLDRSLNVHMKIINDQIEIIINTQISANEVIILSMQT